MTSRLILLLLVFLSVPHFVIAANNCALAVAPIAALANPSTNKFYQLYKGLDQKLSPQELSVLKDYEVIFIPGLFNARKGAGDHATFGLHGHWLRDQGIDQRVLKYPVDHVRETLNYLMTQVSAGPKKKIIVSHSMGSLLTMELFVQKPELMKNISGWISINGALHGSPLADAIVNKVGWALSRKMRETLRNLTEERMEAFHREHSAEIAHILDVVPSLFVSSWINKEMPDVTESRFLRLSKWVRKKGHQWNDGIVPNESAHLGCGNDCVRISQSDHTHVLRDVHIFRALLFMHLM